MEKNELKAILEALLFVSDEPLPARRLQEAVEEVGKPQISEALNELIGSYRDGERGVQIVEVASGYQMVTQPRYAQFIKRLEKVRAPTKLSKSALETLAMIAYKQPVTRSDMETIRGVDSAGVLRTLLERRIVKIVGRREGLGRPMLYATTPRFLQYFGLKDLAELPALREFKEFSETLPEQEPMDGQMALHEPAGESVG